MSDVEKIKKAIANVRAVQVGIPVDVVVGYMEECIRFWEANMTTYRAEIAMQSIIRVADDLLTELRVLDSVDAQEEGR